MKNIDLHIHSRYSDGELNVLKIIKLCVEKDVSVISITDHDEVIGIREAIEIGAKSDVKVIPGVEITTTWKVPLHILAYDFDYKSKDLLELCKNAKLNRLMEFSSIIGKIKKEGISIDLKYLMEKKITSTNGLSKYLYEQGIGESVQDVKKRFFTPNGVAFVSRKGPSLESVVSLVHQNGGKAILAHPGRMRVSKSEFWDYIDEIKRMGIDGIEVYSAHNKNCNELKEYCVVNNLLYTGGSDFHSPKKGTIGIGDNSIPLDWVSCTTVE